MPSRLNKFSTYLQAQTKSVLSSTVSVSQQERADQLIRSFSSEANSTQHATFIIKFARQDFQFVFKKRDCLSVPLLLSISYIKRGATDPAYAYICHVKITIKRFFLLGSSVTSFEPTQWHKPSVPCRGFAHISVTRTYVRSRETTLEDAAPVD